MLKDLSKALQDQIDRIKDESAEGSQEWQLYCTQRIANLLDIQSAIAAYMMQTPPPPPPSPPVRQIKEGVRIL